VSYASWNYRIIFNEEHRQNLRDDFDVTRPYIISAPNFNFLSPFILLM
jgi:hypothetical protein